MIFILQYKLNKNEFNNIYNKYFLEIGVQIFENL